MTDEEINAAVRVALAQADAERRPLRPSVVAAIAVAANCGDPTDQRQRARMEQTLNRDVTQNPLLPANLFPGEQGDGYQSPAPVSSHDPLST